MNCPNCGNTNRPNARFCARCGTLLKAAASPRSPVPRLTATPAASAVPATGAGSADTPQTVSKVGLFGGHGLITFGALLALFAFMLPWASCSGVEVSGFDLVTQSSEYSGDASGGGLVLVPLAALALLALGIAGLALNMLEHSLSDQIGRLMFFLPLAAALPGLCGCGPLVAFFLSVQNARSSPDSMGLGVLIQIEYGFWLTLLGLGVSFIGMILALVGGLAERRRPVPP